MRSSIWITGAHGLIGNYLVQTAARFAPGQKVLGLGRADLDLADPQAMRARFLADQPSAIIHCAAISKTPACQADPPLARRINVTATHVLAELAADISFFFFSTDLVFDGKTGNYDESAPVNPLNVYAETKVAAESLVLQNPRHTVLRTSLNAGASPTGDRSFNEEMRRHCASGRTLDLFVDEFRCPIHASETARAVWELFAHNPGGLFHLAGSERLSRFQIGELLSQRWSSLHPKLKAGSLREYQGAPRAPDTSLNSSKLQKYLAFPLPAFSRWLAEHPDEPV